MLRMKPSRDTLGLSERVLKIYTGIFLVYFGWGQIDSRGSEEVSKTEM